MTHASPRGLTSQHLLSNTSLSHIDEFSSSLPLLYLFYLFSTSSLPLLYLFCTSSLPLLYLAVAFHRHPAVWLRHPVSSFAKASQGSRPTSLKNSPLLNDTSTPVNAQALSRSATSRVPHSAIPRRTGAHIRTQTGALLSVVDAESRLPLLRRGAGDEMRRQGNQ